MDTGTLISLVLSGLALIVSVASAVYTRRTTRIEQERHLVERAPEFEISIPPALEPDATERIWITLTSPDPLTDVQVDLLTATAVFIDSLGETHDERTWLPGPLDPGRPSTCRMDFADDVRPDRIRLRIRSQGAAKRERWVQVVTVDVPPGMPGAYVID